MKLPFDFFKKKTNEEEDYLGVLLKEEEGVVFFFNVRGRNFVKLGQEKFSYTNGWENLAEDLDEILYRMELKIRKSPEKTIFFVYSHLVDHQTGQIKREFLKKIKEVSKSLELKPLGYIECHEAVVNHLKKKEEVEPTALMIEFDKSQLKVFLYKNGKLEYEETVARSANLIDDILPAFEKIKGISILPSRLILYNSRNLDQEITTILGHKWGTDHFVQLPKIEVIREEDLFGGLIDLFASQLFAANQAVEPEEKKEVMGFVIGQDISHTKEEATASQQVDLGQKRKFELSMPAFAGNLLSKTQALFTSLKNTLKNTKLLNKTYLAIIGGTAIIFIILITELFFHKAKLTIFLPYQSINSKLTLTVATNKVVKKTAGKDLAVEKTTSGKREVGEKAKGSVTIHNFDDKEAIFKEGTVLTSKSIKFLLDDDVKVASSSLAPDGSAKLPGKGQAKVTAQEIGTEGNITKDQRFDIENLSSLTYFAINDETFVGGSKKQIKTVSKTDIDLLSEKARGESKKFFEKEIISKIDKNYQVLNQLTNTKLTNSNYSHEVGEESDILKLKTKANITYFILEKNILLGEFMDNLKSKVKEGYVIKKDGTVYKINDIGEEKDGYVLKAEVKSRASQDIKTEELLKKLKGKSSKNVESIIKKDYKSGADIEISNLLPFLRNRFPFRESNISIEISYL